MCFALAVHLLIMPELATAGPWQSMLSADKPKTRVCSLQGFASGACIYRDLAQLVKQLVPAIG